MGFGCQTGAATGSAAIAISLVSSTIIRAVAKLPPLAPVPSGAEGIGQCNVLPGLICGPGGKVQGDHAGHNVHASNDKGTGFIDCVCMFSRFHAQITKIILSPYKE